MSSEIVITDEEFRQIRSSLYQSASSQIEKIAKMIINVTDNLTTIGSNMIKTEDEILNVIEKTDSLVDESCASSEVSIGTATC